MTAEQAARGEALHQARPRAFPQCGIQKQAWGVSRAAPPGHGWAAGRGH